MNEITKVRSDLAAYFRSKAFFRERMARERCWDGSWKKLENEWYAERLEQVAAYVETLPDTDPALSRIAALEVEFPPDGMQDWTIHCDFRGAGVARWFEKWVEGAIDSAMEEDARLGEFS
jgi:hypothetical protein